MTLAIEGAAPAIPPNSHGRWPEITDADRRAVLATLDSGDLAGTSAGDIIALEAEWASYCGTAYCLATSSGTSAIHLALVAAGVNPGDEVITSAYSFAATPMAIVHAGATPVFCDIDPATFNIDPDQIRARITERTAAILPVHIHGLPADMDAIGAIAERRGLAVIEDAAQAHGAVYHGRLAGTLGHGAAFSLNESKPLQAGEGGLYVTDDDTAFAIASRLRVFGEDTPAHGPNEARAFWSHGTGWQYRPPAVTAALARAQLPRLAGYLDRARRNAAILTDGLADVPGVVPPFVPPEVESCWWYYAIRLDPSELGWDGRTTELRDRFISALRHEGVLAGTWQRRPLHALPAFRRNPPQPWTPDLSAPGPWDPDEFPKTLAVLGSTIRLGTERHPLYVQSPELMHGYVAAITKVVQRIRVVFETEYKPVREVPPVPESEVLHHDT